MQKNVYCKYTRDVIVGGATLLTFFNWQPPSDLSSAKNAAAHEHATNELSYFQWGWWGRSYLVSGTRHGSSALPVRVV